MFTSFHSATAIAISRLIPNPIIAVIASFFSHFFVDTLQEHCPQNKDEWKLLIIREIGFNSLILIYILYFASWSALFCVIAANIIDVLKYLKNENFKHPEVKTWISLNFFYDTLFCALAVFLIFLI